MRRGGFTMIELIAVLALSALLATAAVVNLAGVREHADNAYWADQIERYDQRTRIIAERLNQPLKVLVDTERNELRRTIADSGEPIGDRLRLPKSMLVAGVRLQDKTTAYGLVAIPYTPRGDSSTYLLKLAGRHDKSTWLLVAGMSGQTTTWNNATQAKNILTALAGRNAG